MNQLFDDELRYLHLFGEQFVEQNPKLSAFLTSENTDPDVQRIIEGLAYLSSSIRQKAIDENEEFIISLIQLLWPDYLRVFPSVTMVKFEHDGVCDPSNSVIPQGTLLQSNVVRDESFLFQTTSDCIVHPLHISNIRRGVSDKSNIISFELKTLFNLKFSELELDKLDFTILGDSSTQQLIYLWIGRYLKQVTTLSGRHHYLLSEESLTLNGFNVNETILPKRSAAFDGHRLLQEYFAFPNKFYSFKISNLEEICKNNNTDTLVLELEFERTIPNHLFPTKENFALNCVTAVNLFETDAEPLIVDHIKTVYRIRPIGFDNKSVEIFSIDGVIGQRPSNDTNRYTINRQYYSFESFDHELSPNQESEQVFYSARPHYSQTHGGFDYDMSFILHQTDRLIPEEEIVSIDITCFNRKGCDELGIGDIPFILDEKFKTISVKNLTRPTKPIYPPLDKTLAWNLVINLTLNYSSLLTIEAIAAILEIFDFQNNAPQPYAKTAKKRINGFASLTTSLCTVNHNGHSVNGLKSELQVRESAFQTEGDMYLFMSILAKFFSLCATVNSFHELEVTGIENGEVYKWPTQLRSH